MNTLLTPREPQGPPKGSVPPPAPCPVPGRGVAQRLHGRDPLLGPRGLPLSVTRSRAAGSGRRRDRGLVQQPSGAGRARERPRKQCPGPRRRTSLHGDGPKHSPAGRRLLGQRLYPDLPSGGCPLHHQEADLGPATCPKSRGQRAGFRPIRICLPATFKSNLPPWAQRSGDRLSPLFLPPSQASDQQVAKAPPPADLEPAHLPGSLEPPSAGASDCLPAPALSAHDPAPSCLYSPRSTQPSGLCFLSVL